jgi:hypothetical protein
MTKKKKKKKTTLENVLNICNLFNTVIDNVRFFFVESSFLISAVIAAIASSVLTALSRTVSIFSSSSASSAFAAAICESESAFVVDCVMTSCEISVSRDSRWL